MTASRLIAIAAVAAFAAGVAGCHKAAPVRQPCPGGKVCMEFGNIGDPISLNPLKITGTQEYRVVSDLIVGLTQADPAGRPVPGVATSWDVSPDGKTWTFHLRHDVVWSDGAPMTSDDFVYSLRRLMDPAQASEYASVLYVIKNAEQVNAGKLPGTALGVAAPDPYTVVYTLEHPAPYLLELANHQTMYPVPRHVVEKWGDAWTDPGHYVSNGPYTLISWKLGDHIHLMKNPRYYDADKVCVDEVNYYPTTDPVAAEKRVRSGELDENDTFEPNRIDYLRKEMPSYVHAHTYLGTSYFVFNQRDPGPLRDKRVRLALAMAIDREFLTQKLYHGVVQPAYTFVPPGIANYTPPVRQLWTTWPLARRQAAARVLLAQAGFGPKHPLHIELKHPTTGTLMIVMPSVQADWRAIGVVATLAQDDIQILFQDEKQRDFQAAWASWIADYNDAMDFLYLMRTSTGADNYSDYHNPAFDKLLDAADNEPDVNKRADDMRQAEHMMLADQAITPLNHQTNFALVNPNITGWVDNIVDQHRTQYLCRKGAPTPPKAWRFAN
jgi:oligopeptide transport system substrate-binding protein